MYLYVGDVLKLIRLPTSFPISSWSEVFQRNVMFAVSSGVIERSDSLSMEYWEKFLSENKEKGCKRNNPCSMRYARFGRMKPVMF